MRARFVYRLFIISLLLGASAWLAQPARAQPPELREAESGTRGPIESVEAPAPRSSRRTANQPDEAVPVRQGQPPRGPAAGRLSVDRISAAESGVKLFIPKEIGEIGVDIRQTEIDVPDYATEPFEALQRRQSRDQAWAHRQFTWEAPEFWHGPLYFDDVPLERYGQMHHPLIQPVLSGFHFFGNLPLLPYKMGIDRPCDKIATLGYYRVGDCAPPVGRWLPVEVDAAAFEAITVIALIAILP